MPEITRQQIEAYRDSPSRLVTEFDREMARACLAALDRTEAAECEADQLAELVHSLEEQRAFAHEERDKAHAKAKAAETRLRLVEAGSIIGASYARVVEQRDEARAEAARLQDQVAAHIEGTWPAGDLRRAFVAGASWWEYRSTNATMWPSDRRLAEAAAEQRYPAGQLCALAGAGEEKPA